MINELILQPEAVKVATLPGEANVTFDCGCNYSGTISVAVTIYSCYGPTVICGAVSSTSGTFDYLNPAYITVSGGWQYQ